MKTKSNKIAKNINRKHKTRKNISIKPSLKILKKGYPLYASKQYEGSTILEYNKNEELKYNDKCLMQNSSWFGDLNVAKSYKTKDTNDIKLTYTHKTGKLLNNYETVHSAQGKTIDINYSIYDISKMTIKILYTALSRCTNKDKITIYL